MKVFSCYKYILIPLAISLCINLNPFFQLGIAEGESMLPNFSEKNIGLYAFPDKIERGEVYSISGIDKDLLNKFARDPYETLLKRVVGLPGETVQVKDGHVYINGEILDEDYNVIMDENQHSSMITLGEDEYYVLGDNRPVSCDSRYLGVIKRSSLKEKLIWNYDLEGLKSFFFFCVN